MNQIEEIPISQNMKNNAKAIISSETYVGYLRNQKKKKDVIEQKKKKERLRKAEEKLSKMSANVHSLRAQVQSGEKE